MANPNPKNPYRELVGAATKWAYAVVCPRKIPALVYRNGCGSYTLATLHHSVVAADKMGYDVVMTVDGEVLTASYVQRPPPAPWPIRP